RLHRVRHARVGVRGRREVLEVGVDEAAQAREAPADVVGPGLPAFHGAGLPLRSRTRWIARTRRAAPVVARAVSVAPDTGRTPRPRESSSSSFLPGNCAYQWPRGR